MCRDPLLFSKAMMSNTKILKYKCMIHTKLGSSPFLKKYGRLNFERYRCKKVNNGSHHQILKF